MAKVVRKKLDAEETSASFSEMFRNAMDSVINPKDLPEQVTIPTGISIFDKIIGGGFLTGTYISFAAPPGSGKSTFCLQLEAQFKRMCPDGFVIHIDSEQATTNTRMQMLGINIGKDDRIWKISYDATIEEVFKCIDEFIALKEKWATDSKDPNMRGIPTLVVWDSVDASATMKELECDSVEKAMGQRAKQLGFFIRRALRNFRKYNILFATVNHITKKLAIQGPYEPYDGSLSSLKGFTISGGKPVTYYPSSLIFLRGHEPNKQMRERIADDYHLDSAFIVEASTLKCKSFSYNMTVELVFDTMRGFDDFTTKIHNMFESEWFVSEGRSYLLQNLPDVKFKIADIGELYKTDATFKEKFDETWNDYLEARYGRFTAILKQLADQNANVDMSGVTQNIDIHALEDIAKEVSVKTDTFDESGELREAVFEEPKDTEATDGAQ